MKNNHKKQLHIILHRNQTDNADFKKIMRWKYEFLNLHTEDKFV